MNVTAQNIKQKIIDIGLIRTFFVTALYYLLASVLLLSGIFKIVDPIPTIKILNMLNILFESFNLIILSLLPVAEIALSLMMFLKVKLKITLFIVTLLFFFLV